MSVFDTFQRPIRDLRISVTDRCNFRCTYCMPFDEYEWMDRKQVLTFEEIARIAGIFSGLGVAKVRLTGGEPLVRRNLHELVRLLAGGNNGEENISYATLVRTEHYQPSVLTV